MEKIEILPYSHDSESWFISKIVGKQVIQRQDTSPQEQPRFPWLPFGNETRDRASWHMRDPHLSWPYAPSSNTVYKITSLEALYKLSKIIQMALVIILRSKWVGILVLSWLHKEELVSKEHFLNFLPLEVLLPFSFSLWWQAAPWHFSSHEDLAGPVVDPGRHTPRLRKSLLCSQLGTLTYGARICFDPKKEYHFKCFMLKHTTGSKICLPVECSARPALLQAYAPTHTRFLTVARHSLSRDVNTGAEPLKKRSRRKTCTLSGCEVAGCTRFLRAPSP